MRLFIDTEFTSFDQPQLTSIGICVEGIVPAEVSSKFYYEISDYDINTESDFFKTEVKPLMQGSPSASFNDVGSFLLEWIKSLNSFKVEVIADFHGDFIFFDKLLEEFELPFEVSYSLVGDLVNNIILLESLSTNRPEILSEHQERMLSKAEAIFIKTQEDYFLQPHITQHHALHDAEALLTSWLAAKEALLPPVY